MTSIRIAVVQSRTDTDDPPKRTQEDRRGPDKACKAGVQWQRYRPEPYKAAESTVRDG